MRRRRPMSLRLRQGLRLESVGPVAGLLSFMGERNDSDLVVCDRVHDQIGIAQQPNLAGKRVPLTPCTGTPASGRLFSASTRANAAFENNALRPRSRSSYQRAAPTSSSSASSSSRTRRVTCRRAQCRPAVAQRRDRLPATHHGRTVRLALRLFSPIPPPVLRNTRGRDFRDWRTTQQPREFVPPLGATTRRSTLWLRLYPRPNRTSDGGPPTSR